MPASQWVTVLDVITVERSRLGIWKPPTSNCTRLQKMPTMASSDATTTSGFVRSFGTKAMTAARAQPTTSTQKNGAKGPETSMATISAPSACRKAAK